MEREDYVEEDHTRAETKNKHVKRIVLQIRPRQYKNKADGMIARVRVRMPEDRLMPDVQEFARSMSIERGVVCDEL